MIDPADLVITVAYFSIPLQIVASLVNYPRFSNIPVRLIVLLILFALFILLCGFGHLLRCMHMTNSPYFYYTNTLTAVVSLITALYLLPLIPNLLKTIDKSITKTEELLQETVHSKAQLMTFMAFLCHEIRNPLFAITSAITFLSDTKMTTEQELISETVHDSSKLILRLVNDVLDLNRIESGKMEMEDRTFDLHRLMTCIQTNMSLQIKKKHGNNVSMLFDIDEKIPQNVYGDSTRILQILYNLLSNSCKFTDKGHIKLQMSFLQNSEHSCTYSFKPGYENSRGTPMTGSRFPLFESSQFSMGTLGGKETNTSSNNDQQEGVLKIVVEDTGTGISSERLEHIFEPYAQSKLSDYRKHGGAGLGLPIVSSLIKRMGGEITVESQPGRGSRFTIHVPFQVSLHGDDDVIVMDENETLFSCDPEADQKQYFAELVDAGILGEDDHAVHMDILDTRPAIEYMLELEGSNADSISENTDELPPLPSLEKKNNIVSITTSNPDKAMTKKKKKKKKGSKRNFNSQKGKEVVLVTDDNILNCQIIAKMLSHFNVEYRLAHSGKEAVDIMLKSENVTSNPEDIHFSYILMDLQMPVMNGYQATEAIRNLGLAIPIIVLTANAVCEERKKSLLAGANEFHTKPILRENIYALCCKYIQGNVSSVSTETIVKTTKIFRSSSLSMPSFSPVL